MSFAETIRRPLVIATLGIVLALLTLLTLGARVWLEHHTATYALERVREALRTHDHELFHEYVDVDSVLSRAMDDIGRLGLGESEDSGLAQGILALLKPNMLEALKQRLDRAIDETDTDRGASAVLGRLGPVRVVGESRSGTIVLLSLAIVLPHMAEETTIELKLREFDGHLRLFEIGGLDAVLRKVQAAEKKWKLDANVKVFEELHRAVTFKSFQIRSSLHEIDDGTYANENWDESEMLTFVAVVQNDSDDAANDIVARIFVRDERGRLLLSEDVRFSKAAVPAHSSRKVTFVRASRGTTADGALVFHADRYHLGSVTPLSVSIAGRTVALPYPEEITEPAVAAAN